VDSRRAFLRFLAASPFFANGVVREALAQSAAAASAAAGDGVDPMEALVTKASDALDIFDLQRAAKQSIPATHWGYLTTGVDGEETLKANRGAFSHWQLHTKRLVDLSNVDLSAEIFGTRYASPIYLSALGEQKAFHRDGEVGSARAAKTHNQLQMLSTVTSYSVEDVTEARGAPIWYQLYASSSFDITMKLVKRAEKAGCPVLAVTVDLPLGRNTETITRWRRLDRRNCLECHGPNGPTTASLPMYKGLDLKGIAETTPLLTWDFVRRVKDGTKMKVIIKGLESAEDATLAVKYGMDGVVVSNHGGRATETGRGTLDSLPGVVKAVHGRIPVFLDGGVRRGTDALKALALGATAVGIGRAYAFGLGAFGEAGVDRALTILNEELRFGMVGVGARTVKEITAATVIATKLDSDS
jgi:isopentenyl diphosphate isomerase/L-lactate dehydrogenase-like FMN-dependent dehydrogenase